MIKDSPSVFRPIQQARLNREQQALQTFVDSLERVKILQPRQGGSTHIPLIFENINTAVVPFANYTDMKGEKPEIRRITCGITIEISRSWPRVRPEVFIAMAHDRGNHYYECYNSHIKGIPGLPVGIMCLFSDWHSIFGLTEVVRRAWAVLSYIQIHNPNERDTFNVHAARWYKDMVSANPDLFPLDTPLPFAGGDKAGGSHADRPKVRIGMARG